MGRNKTTVNGKKYGVEKWVATYKNKKEISSKLVRRLTINI